MMAFVKILKKFDKVSLMVPCPEIYLIYISNSDERSYIFMCQVTAKEVQQIYLKVVESSYYNSSDKVFCNNGAILRHFQ